MPDARLALNGDWRAGGDMPGAHGVPIHCGVVKGWAVAIAMRGLGQHATSSVGERDGLSPGHRTQARHHAGDSVGWRLEHERRTSKPNAHGVRAPYTPPVNIDVLVFGAAAQLAQANRIVVTVSTDDVTARAVLEAVATQHPRLAAAAASGRLAVNHEFAQPETPLHENDEVALIALVGGG